MKTTVTRRRFLELSLAGSSALGLAGLLPVGCAKYPAAPSGLKVLSAKEYAVLKAITERIIPRGGPYPEGAGDLDVAQHFDAFISGEPEKMQSLFKRALVLFEHGPLFFTFTPRRFTALSDAEKDEYIRGWARSRFEFRRSLYGVFKKLSCFIFYSRPIAWAGIGYDGPWIGRTRRK